jgi:Tol biopolymer transport system component
VSDWIFGMTWSRDRRQIIYSALEAGMTSLWRFDTDGGTPPERIEIAGTEAWWPTIAPSADRLVFSRDHRAYVPYRFEVGQPSRPLLTSSRFSGGLDFSPDGNRIAYCASSGDTLEVWTARADGSTPVQLTRGLGRWQCSPRWSPDGRQIAFDSQSGDYQWHIWTTDADGGGTPRQVTSDSGNAPTWSRDSQWIYYSGRNFDLWRIHLADGRKQQLTHEGNAWVASESADGTTLVYSSINASTSGSGALLAMPLAGGPSHQIVPCVAGWAVSTRLPAIYYVTCSPGSVGWGSADSALHVLNASTGADRVLGTLERYSSISFSGLAVSPDGKVVVYERLQREGHDLMLIENFR